MKPYRKPSQTNRPTPDHPQGRKLSRRETRQEAILQAAVRLFADKGYGATSLHDIVHLSGGSLSTLYALFHNKAGLFHAIVTRRCEQMTSILNRPDVFNHSVSETLTEQGIRFLSIFTDENTLATIRMIIAESAQFPELAQAFDNDGPANGRQRVAAYLAEQMRRGILRADDPVRAAADFCYLALRDTQMKAILGLPYPKTRDAIEQQVAYAVKQFLRLYQKESDRPQDPQSGSF